MRVKEVNRDYVDFPNKGFLFRFRIWLAVKLIPGNLNDFGKLWAMGFHTHGGSILKSCCPEMAKHLEKIERAKKNQ